MNTFAEYRHTQRSPMTPLILAVAVGVACLAWMTRDELQARIVLSSVSLLLIVAAGSFHQLTVGTEQSGLLLQFGPIPLFHKRIPYAAMESVAPSRSRLIDGWGIHYIPLRGWTYNVWGFGCVLIHRHADNPIRVGTDDAPGLHAALRERIGHEH